jgi:hypothetical protein
MDTKDLLVGGSTFSSTNDPKDNKLCYLPIFRNKDPGAQWVFGAKFMEKYYMVFDMRKADQGKNYL